MSPSPRSTRSLPATAAATAAAVLLVASLAGCGADGDQTASQDDGSTLPAPTGATDVTDPAAGASTDPAPVAPPSSTSSAPAAPPSSAPGRPSGSGGTDGLPTAPDPVFCGAIGSLATDLGALAPDAYGPISRGLNQLADELLELGVPVGFTPRARQGFAVFMDFLESLTPRQARRLADSTDPTGPFTGPDRAAVQTFFVELATTCQAQVAPAS